MQHRRVAAVMISGAALTATHVQALQFSAPELRVVLEGSIGAWADRVSSLDPCSRFLILVIAIEVSIHLIYWIGALWRRHGLPSPERWIEGHK